MGKRKDWGPGSSCLQVRMEIEVKYKAGLGWAGQIPGAGVLSE